MDGYLYDAMASIASLENRDIRSEESMPSESRLQLKKLSKGLKLGGKGSPCPSLDPSLICNCKFNISSRITPRDDRL